MITTLRESLGAAMRQVQHYARLVNWQNVNNIHESEFRFLVLAEIMKQAPHAKCQIEWKRYDLVVAIGKRSFVIEFKFFFGFSRTYSLTDMTPKAWKGGPSRQNEKEVQDCLDKLHELDDSRIVGKYLVLVYELGPWENHTNSFEKSYSNLHKKFKNIKRVQRIRHCLEDRSVCELITVE